MDSADEGRAGPRESSELARHPALDAGVLTPRALLGGLPDAVVAAARDGTIVFVNDLAEELFGYAREELIGRPVQSLWPERERDRYSRNMALYFETEHPLRFSAEAAGLRRDGSEFVGEMSWGIVETSGGPLLLAIGRDVSARHAAESRLRALARIGESALAGVAPRALAAEAVAAMRELLPLDGAEVVLGTGEALTTVQSAGAIAAEGLRVALVASDELRLSPPDELRLAPRRTLADDETDFVRAIAAILATALARLRTEEQIRHAAVHDPLTGLANRTLLSDRLEHALARSSRDGGATGVLFVDLDHFKRVNDEHGHAMGDAVLAQLGGRLRAVVRPADTVARIGGDEFVVVCEDVDERSALGLAQRLLSAIEAPLRAAGVTHRLSACVGVALAEGDPDALLRNADAAAYRAKASGRGRVEMFGA